MFYPRSYYLTIEAVQSICVGEREKLAAVACKLIDFAFGLFHGGTSAFGGAGSCAGWD